MAPGLDLERLGLAFPTRPDLVADIQHTADSPSTITLFNKISGYICDLAAADEPALKRRRVEGGSGGAPPAATNGNGSGSGLPSRQAQKGGSAAEDMLSAAAAETVLLEIKDVSVSIPQRKKLDLVITQNYLYARAANTTAPVPGIVYSWHSIEHVFYLPVPEKAQVQYNYVLLPPGAALASLTAPAKPADPSTKAQPPPPPPPAEPLVFTVPATAPKPGSVAGPSAGLAAAVSDSYRALLHWAIEGQLRSVANRHVSSIVSPDAKVFHSAARQPFRPQEKAVHVRAFRGSKDGYLFFLPTGILWAFKKPLLFIPLDRIAAVSYTNVLQRTFNIVVEVDVGGSGGGGGDSSSAAEEVEFGMLDQEDYGGIDETYVRRHGLQDRSMAERRKAKRELAENARGEKKEGEAREAGEEGEEGEGAAADEDDGMTELQRAEQMLQDAEDEEEEDYDPGSDGDSDGSGSSSSGEEDNDGGGDEDGEDDEDEDEEEEEEAGADADGAMAMDR